MVIRAGSLVVATLACAVMPGCGSDESSSDQRRHDAGADVSSSDGSVADAKTSDGAPDVGKDGATDGATDGAADGATDAGPEPVLPVTPFTVEVWTWDQTNDSCSYSNNGNPFWDWMAVGREPDVAGKYPLFLYLHGTGDVA